MTDDLIDECSAALWAAERECKRISPLSGRFPDLSEQDAYAIARRTFDRRERPLIGYKLGYTSAAMREQMGIDRPNFGLLSDDRILPRDGTVDTERLVHPLVEPEIAIVTGRDLAGTGHDATSVAEAVDTASASLEIVDSRYESYVFQAVDNIADNSSSARLVLGNPVPRSHLDDLRLIGVLLAKNNAIVDQGIGYNAMGDPLAALAWLVNVLAERDEMLPAGSIVLTGGLTRAYPACASEVFSAHFAQLGSVTAAF